ncbi:DNA binding protein [Vibrio phage River4]|uniref:A2 protein n=1 Tax=Vibrio phage River4 TaxID=2736288 RepID=A0A6M9Z0E3_9CAUD|nr:DNA binding protein [Vibrio phage River4]YP_010108042.1 DNA binding protein [Vibrio phage River4]QKN84675.1 A2 protein [Vibrio phage River4]QKN84856.1 A2 protein [Vibrio phage River4]
MAKKWTEEMAEKAATLYTAKLEAEGKEAAAHTDFLDTIAVEVEAVSGKAVRSKLTVMGVYQKPDAVASVAKTNTVRKEHYVRALAHTLGLDADDLDSLKNAKMSALEAIATAIGITDIQAASAKDYEPDLEKVCEAFENARGLDL